MISMICRVGGWSNVLALAVVALALLGCSYDDGARLGLLPTGANAEGSSTNDDFLPAAPMSAPEHEQKASIRAAYLAMRMKEAAKAPQYAITAKPGEFPVALGQGGHLRATFDERGVLLESTADNWQARLDVAAVGCRGALEQVESAEPVPTQGEPNRLTYRRRAGKIRFSEEWASGEPGIEQTLTISEHPPCKGRDVLLRIVAQGLVPDMPHAEAEGNAVELRDGSGTVRLRYADLLAYDAADAMLPTSMTVDGERIAIQVDTAGAKWPIVVDPLVAVQEAKLSEEFGAAEDRFGISVALDADTALIGAYGAAYIFVRQGTSWDWQATLRAADGAEGDYFGPSVALSGHTALVGAAVDGLYMSASAPDAAYVFVRNGTTWSEEQKLTATDGATSHCFGCSVALDADTALVGAYGDMLHAGSAYVFHRTGSTWTQQQKLTASDGAPFDDSRFGYAVALSGETALVGAPEHNRGAVYVLQRNGTGWTEQEIITPSGGEVTWNVFGQAVALDGDTALIGRYSSAHIFLRTSAGWAEQQILGHSDFITSNGFGKSVALSGEAALVGDSYSYKAYAYLRAGNTWTEEQILKTSNNADLGFGGSVALSGDTAVIGAGSDHTAYVYLRNTEATWKEHQMLTSNVGAAYDFFGSSVAVSGEIALVGATGNDAAGAGMGAAYVFQRSNVTWRERQRLEADDAIESRNFGQSIATSGDIALIGTSGTERSAYVFARNGTDWTQQSKLTPSDGAPNNWFGYSVALSRDTALIGAFATGAYQGSAYVFTRNGTNWLEQQKLTGSDAAAGDYFGYSVATSGDNVLVGAKYSNRRQGSVYVFARNGSNWIEKQKLTASDAAAEDCFGSSVALDANTAIIGAYADTVTVGMNTDNRAQGSAYVFVLHGTTWTEQQRLTADDGAANDLFGQSVALSGDTALVGALQGFVGNLPGAAYLFVRSDRSWIQQRKLTASDGAANEVFGASVALAGDTAVIGAEAHDVGTMVNQGAAYVFRLHGLAGQRCNLKEDCASPYFCSDNVCCTTECNGPCEVCSAARGATRDGTCTPKPLGATGDPPCPNNVLCTGTSGTCPTGCTLDQHCPSGTFCAWGACQLKKGAGAPCSGANECTTGGGCVDGVCCNESCAGACEACLSTLSTGRDGVCSPAAAGTLGTPICVGDVLCDGLTRACPSQCNQDAHCASSQYCELTTGTCQPKKASGLPCLDSHECSTPGGCVDAVCCNTPCTGLCQACAARAKVAGADGECGNAKGGTDPHGQCGQDSPTTCRQNGLCDDSGACANYDTTTICGVPICVGNESRPRVCAGAFDCSPSAAGTDCAPYRCNPSTGECLTTCLVNSDCVGTGYCDPATSLCAGKKIDGQPCTSGSMCASSYCVDGVCCDSDCAGICSACSTKLKGHGVDGDCEAIASGLDPDEECTADAEVTCKNNGQCDGVGACAVWRAGTDCSMNVGANVCTGNRAVGRVCVGPGECALRTDGLDCGPQKCIKGSCADCQSDQDCVDPNSSYCNPGGQCQPKRFQGEACFANSECLSKHCVDGVCCESDCPGQCEWCGHPEAPGQCLVVDGQPHGSRAACPHSGSLCGGSCDGSTRDGCSFPGFAKECGAPPACVGDFIRSAASCDGAGVCSPGSLTDCGAYACDAIGLECATSCTTRSQCRLGAVCDTTQGIGTCVDEGATCVGGFDVKSVDGAVDFCRGFACLNGRCQQQCGETEECAPGYLCQDHLCLVRTQDAPVARGGAAATTTRHDWIGGGGCDCNIAGRKHASSLFLLLALALARRKLQRGGERPLRSSAPRQSLTTPHRPGSARPRYGRRRAGRRIHQPYRL